MKSVGTIINDDEPIPDLDISCSKIEELIDGGAVRFYGVSGIRLVCGTVGVVDEVDGWVVDFEMVA